MAIVFGQGAVRPQSNIVINPGLGVLMGTHTTTIQRNNVASSSKNHEVVGWRSTVGPGSPNILVSGDSTTVPGGAGMSLKVSVISVGSSDPIVEIPYVKGESSTIDSMLFGTLGLTLTFSAEVKMSIVASNAVRLFITSNGTGGGTTSSLDHEANTNWERLIVSRSIPLDATQFSIGMEMSGSGVDYFLSRPMAVPTDSALRRLSFVARPSMTAFGNVGTNNSTADFNTVATVRTVSTNGAAHTTPWDVNAGRKPWETAFMATCRITGNVGDVNNAVVAPNGSGAWDLRITRAGATAGWNFGVVRIGADGQFEAMSSNSSNTFVAFKTIGIGYGL